MHAVPTGRDPRKRGGGRDPDRAGAATEKEEELLRPAALRRPRLDRPTTKAPILMNKKKAFLGDSNLLQWLPIVPLCITLRVVIQTP